MSSLMKSIGRPIAKSLSPGRRNSDSVPMDRIPPGAIMRMVEVDGVMTDIVGLSIISGTWPDCIVQAIEGGPLENFGPFAGAAQVGFATLPQSLCNQFFWGDRGYVFYSSAQTIANAKRIFNYLNSDSYVDYLYVNGDQVFSNGEPIAAIFGATI